MIHGFSRVSLRIARRLPVFGFVVLVLCAGLGLPSDRALLTGPAPGTRSYSHACRFWGLVGREYPPDLIADHLKDGQPVNLKTLGNMYTDGWGFASYLAAPYQRLLSGPLIRRGGPRSGDPAEPEYDRAVLELARLRPRAALGHVRLGTSGHWGIPNPHPFEHEGMVFAHNGSLPEALLEGLLTEDDPEYLLNHPPDYVNGTIDSELYFLFLLKTVHENPGLSLPEGLRRGVEHVAKAVGECRLNFVLTRGDTLYALRFSSGDQWDPVRYLPGPDLAPDPPASSWWVTASQPVGSHPERWGTIPPYSLGVFVPGRVPRFLPVHHSDEGGQAMTAAVSAERGSAGDTGPVQVGEAFPNPTTGPCSFSITLPQGVGVQMDLYDVQGRAVRHVEIARPRTGENNLAWDGLVAGGARAAQGQYFARIQVGERRWERKVTVLNR